MSLKQVLVGELVQLEAVVDAVLFRQMDEEEERKGWPKNRRGLPAGSIAAPVAVGAGALALRKRYGADEISGAGNQIKATYRGAMREAGDIARNAPGAWKATKQSFRGNRNLQGRGVMRSGINAVKKGASKLFMHSAVTAGLQELNAVLDATEFTAPDHRKPMSRAKKVGLGLAGVATAGAIGHGIGANRRDAIVRGAKSGAQAVVDKAGSLLRKVRAR